MTGDQLDETVSACLNLIDTRFPDGEERGASAPEDLNTYAA